jgi:ADP-heptose:LPS heptosyltransferase
VHTAEHIASAMFWLGVPNGPIPRAKLFADVPNSPSEKSLTGRMPAPQTCESLTASGGAGLRPAIFGTERLPPQAAKELANYVVLHPFASEPGKIWPAAHFLETAAHLKGDGLEPVFVGGPDDDVSPFQSFRVLRDAPLAEVKNLMAGAQIFIGNDSGPAHIAAAFGIPVVAIFGSSNPVTWAPWRTEARVLTSPQGIDAIETAEVIAAIDSLTELARTTERCCNKAASAEGWPASDDSEGPLDGPVGPVRASRKVRA